MKTRGEEVKAYIIKISFEEITPEIWRRIILPAGGTFYRLHQTIQQATNFTSAYEPYHLFHFKIGDELITDSQDLIEDAKGNGQVMKSARRVKFDAYLENYEGFIYTYDFGDNWQIKVELEKVVDDYHFGYPTILEGEETAPPEDVGGTQGYRDFLAIYHDPTHAKYLSTYEWAEKQRYNMFNIDSLNDQLKAVKYKKTDWSLIQHKNYQILSDHYRTPDIIDLTKLANKELIIQYAIAFGNFYGVLDYNKFIEIYNSQNSPALSRNELVALVSNILYKKMLENHHVYVHPSRLVHESIEYFDDLGTYLEVSAGKPYYIPDKEELLRYTDDFYFEETMEQARLASMLAKDFFGGSTMMVREEIEEIIGQATLFGENVNELISYFLSRFELENQDQINVYVKAIVDVANNVRLWENRGHTPHELLAMERPYLKSMSPPPSLEVIKGGKVGRNDPCPCGSGRKYKRCCGK